MKILAHATSHRGQRGAGALLAVVLLCAAMATVVMFTNRSLVFEQKSSANQYRSTIAMNAAEAGLEWATAMLNKSGRVTQTCTDSSLDTDADFRQRYLAFVSTTKNWSPVAGSGAVVAACVTSQRAATDATAPATDHDWVCSCPTAGTAPSLVSPPIGGFKPGFAVAIVSNPAARSFDVVSYGCTSAITSSTCAGDAAATVRATIASVPAVATAPGAPLTVRGMVNVGDAAMSVQNSDPSSGGVTVNAGMAIAAINLRITATPGTPPTSTLVGNDDMLRNVSEERMFQAIFGVPHAMWRDSVADAILNCPCTDSDVSIALAGKKRKLWLSGDLRLETNRTFGSVDEPFVMIVDGGIEMRGDPGVYGLVYSTAVTWDNSGAGNAMLVGAAIAEGNYTGNGTPSHVYDPRVIANLSAIPGRFVRVPGSWRDF
jgi:Tfp pilus assembly protein PilX